MQTVSKSLKSTHKQISYCVSIYILFESLRIFYCFIPKSNENLQPNGGYGRENESIHIHTNTYEYLHVLILKKLYHKKHTFH